MTEANVTIVEQNDSSLVTFQRLTSSGLLTVRPAFDLTSFLVKKQCLYFVYMRGRFSDDRPLIPDEIRFNQSLCLTCLRKLFSKKFHSKIFFFLILESELTPSKNINSTIQSVYNSSTRKIKLLVDDLSTSASVQYSSYSYRKGLHK
jgi:hypothetical protein